MKLARFLTIASLLVLAASSLPLTSDAKNPPVTSYRYWLDVRKCTDWGFRQKVASTAPYRYDVQTDASGRVTRIQHYWGGKQLSDARYSAFEANGMPTIATRYRNGQPYGKTVYHRNAQGCSTRIDADTIAGTLTDYTTNVLTSNTWTSTYYKADGTPTGRDHYVYGPAGTEVQDIYYTNVTNKSHWLDQTIDPKTGNVLESKEYDNGKFYVKKTYQYDTNDILVRAEGFGPDGRQYLTDDYSDGDLVKESYTFDSGATREITRTYDADDYLVKAEQRDDGTLNAVFTFDRLPNHSVKKTIVRSATGTLLAEFPDHIVTQVERDGTTINNWATGTIYQTPPWW